MKWFALLIFPILLLFNGCALEVVPAGPDTYTVAGGGGLGFTPASGPVRARVYKTANTWCAARGLVMVPVAIDERPGEMGRHTAQVELTFRALRPGDPEIKRPMMEKPDYTQRIQMR